MIISYANSIRFRKVDSNYRNFDNTLLQDELFFNDKIFTYCQRFLETDTVTIQIKSDLITAPTIVLYDSENNQTPITPDLVSNYDQDSDGTDDLWFFEFDVVMSGLTDQQYLTVTQGSEVFRSEPFYADSELLTELQNGEAVKVEYYNADNAFQIDFSDELKTGITFFLYVEGYIKDYGFGGESSVYDNQNELTKLKETVSRLMTLKTLYIPRYLAETLRIASSCDVFVVNSISYVREDLPEIAPVEGSNLVEFTTTLNDKEYLGINSHDIGFDCDSVTTGGEIMVLTELNASGGVSFSIPAGYMVHTMRTQWVSGTTVSIKLGTTLAGDELVYSFDISTSFTDVTAAIHGDISRGSDSTIYATISGGIANVDIQLIQNTQ